MDCVTVNGFSYSTDARPPAMSRVLGPDGKPYQIGGQEFRDGMPIPHPITFQGVVGSIRTYRTTWDEALRHNRTNAVAMRRDCFLMGLLRERQLPTARMKWHLEPDDPKNTTQKAVADECTKILKAIPHLQKLQMALLEAIWYGRYGSQFIWGKKKVGGIERKMPVAHEPVNGDKIQFTFDGIPGILVHTAYASQIKDAVLERTDRGPMLLLHNDYWRQRFALHKHEIHDADYLEPELAGGIHGVGVRSLIYWCWWLEAEVTTWILDFFERVGQGVQVFYYEAGNPESEVNAYKAAEQQSRSNVIVWPRPPGSEKTGAGVEWIQPNMSGADILIRIVKEHFDARMERLIIGQTLSSKAESTGLGSSVADLHADTKFKVIAYDADNLAETMTTDVVEPVKMWNFPDTDFGLRWCYDIEKPESDKKLDACKKVYDMGIPLKQDEVREFAGLSKPTEQDDVAEKQEPEPFAAIGGRSPDQPGSPRSERDEQPKQVPAREREQPLATQPAPPAGKEHKPISLKGVERSQKRFARQIIRVLNKRFAAFREEEHPRNPDGEFKEKGERSQQAAAKIKDFLDNPRESDYAAIRQIVADVGSMTNAEIKSVGETIQCHLNGRTKAALLSCLENWLGNIKLSADQSSFSLKKRVEPQHVADTLRKLTTPENSGLIDLVDFRKQFADVPRPGLDQAIHDAMRAGLVTGATYEGRHGITPEQQAAGLMPFWTKPGENVSPYGYLMLRQQPAKIGISPATEDVPIPTEQKSLIPGQFFDPRLTQRKLFDLGKDAPKPHKDAPGQGKLFARNNELRKRIEQAASETDTEPSEEQKAAGNYRKGKFRWNGLDLVIENPRGSTRCKHDSNGNVLWSVQMPTHYGYIKRTESEADGDHVDMFFGPDPESDHVYIVNQNKPDGSFDEHKCLLGFLSPHEAFEAYIGSYDRSVNAEMPPKALGIDEFKAWLSSGDTGKPKRYAREGSGRWVTIGGHEVDGKKHVGGSPVYIENGKITKGHPSLTGKNISALGEEGEEGSHRKQLNQSREYNRAVWGKKARKEGVDPKHLHQLAAEILEHDNAYKQDQTKLLQQARKLSTTLGFEDLNGLAMRNRNGTLDDSLLKGFDVVADSMGRAHPELMGTDDSNWSSRLFDLLMHGNPQPMTEDEAYESAFNHLGEEKQRQDEEAAAAKPSREEEVPFRRQEQPYHRELTFLD